MKHRKIKGKLFRLKHKTFNTKDIKSIEGKINYESIYISPGVLGEKRLGGMIIRINLLKEESVTMNYSANEMYAFNSEFNKAKRKIKEYQNKTK